MKRVIAGIAVALCACGGQDGQARPEADQSAMSPEALVQEYVERDADGERLRTAPWFLQVVAWPEEPAFDSYTVIASYAVEKAVTHGDTVGVPVTYRRIGWIEAGQDSARLVVSDSTERHRFLLLQVDGQWRIAAPRLDPHVLVDTVLSKAPLVARDHARLDEIRSRLGSPRM